MTHGLGERMAVQLMQLNIALTDEPVDLQGLSDSILRLSRSSVLRENTFKLWACPEHSVQAFADWPVTD